MPDTLIYQVKNSVASLVIDRQPQRNALTHDIISLFLTRLDEAEGDPSVRAVSITGAGDKAFCSGADLAGAAAGDMGRAFADYARLLKRISSFPKPTLAMVNGYCMAGGMGLMLACDMVIARPTAKFGAPEVNVGLWPMMIGALIYRNAPKKKAMEMILTAKKLTAAQAMEMGLITRVAAPERLNDEAAEILAGLVSRSPIGIRLGKRAFYEMEDMPFEEALDFLSGKIAEVASTDDAKEGVMAFIEKRPPVFSGR